MICTKENLLVLSVPGAHERVGNPRIALGRTQIYEPSPVMTVSYDKTIKLVTMFNTPIANLSMSSLIL